MLCTKQKVLRRFWYATIPVAKLDDGPKPFTLLGEKIVLFLDGEGKPAALADRCCHRTAKLSKGWSQDGYITCGYHGWTYDRAGKLVRIPQFPPEQPLPDARVKAFRLRHALRLRVGRARGAVASHSRLAGGSRSRLPAHPSVR